MAYDLFGEKYATGLWGGSAFEILSSACYKAIGAAIGWGRKGLKCISIVNSASASSSSLYIFTAIK